VPPNREGRAVILTSGTTGTPKGASRGSPQSLDPAVALLSKIPLNNRQVTHIAAPLFHSWGFAHFSLGLILGSTYVLRRKFDPEACLAEVSRHRCDSLVVVPVMMQRIMELPEETRRKYDLSSLKVVAASGSALPGDLAIRWMDEFGDTLYNLYGSTEVAWATIATPEDMRVAPGTAGRPPRGTVVRLYDERGAEVAPGQTGRIFVGNELLFEGYTGGGEKDVIDGLMATGDVGRMDEAGRLFVEGRDDEMIVSGGENVFPKEVEDLLSRHEAVADAAAIGVEDKDFGQRLRAFVVLEKGKKASEDDLKEYVKKNLARYKVPREVVFLDELPRNATGKVMKRELAEVEPEKTTG
jgi:acyl-CoA synthetase (AMP-forming)/AMP-acid ligase II